jgi:transcriptional regulator with XRE-family HTH domain
VSLVDAVRDVVGRLLTERGMSGRQLALAAGVNERAMARKLSGASPFDLADLEALAPVLDVTAAEIVEWAERA